jgi:hypothetical protein
MRFLGTAQQLTRNLGQLRYPRELRIAAPVRTDDLLPALERVAAVLTALASSDGPSGSCEVRTSTATATRVVGSSELEGLIAAVATRLLLLKRLLEPLQDQSVPRRAYRHVEAMWDRLGEDGIEIVDHTDQPYVAGMQLTVQSWQPTPGLTGDVVVETTKPSVYIRGVLIQMGEVHVAVPER